MSKFPPPNISADVPPPISPGVVPRPISGSGGAPVPAPIPAPISSIPPPIMTSPRDAAHLKAGKLAHGSGSLVLPPPPTSPPPPDTGASRPPAIAPASPPPARPVHSPPPAEEAAPQVCATPPPARPVVPPPPLDESEGIEDSGALESSAAVEPPSTPAPAPPPASAPADATVVPAGAAPTPPPPPPQDYEQLTATIPLEDMYCSDERMEEPLQELVHIPDVLSVLEFSKHHRTKYEQRPENSEDLEEYVKLCYHFFSSKWKLLHIELVTFTKAESAVSVYDLESQAIVSSDSVGAVAQSAKLMLQRTKAPTTSRRGSNVTGKEEEAPVVEVGLKEDDPFFVYSKPYNERTDKENWSRRQRGRLGTLDIYDPLYKWAPGTEIALCHRIRATGNPEAKRKKRILFRVTPQEFHLSLGVFEPFFCTLSMYEVTEAGPKEKKLKLSESFSFDLNDESIALMTGEQVEINRRARSSGCLFGVSNRSTNVYLVLEIEKVFQGEPEIAIDPYLKYQHSVKQKEKDKVQDKLKTEAPLYCSNYGRFRQPFGWACTPVFNFKGDLILDGNFTFSNVYQPAKEPIPDLIQALYANHPKTKLHEPPEVTKELSKRIGREMGASLTVRSYVVEEDFDEVIVLDSSLQPILDTDGYEPDFDDYSDFPVREIQEFAQGPVRHPHLSFMNNLYLYPLSLNFGKVSAARSIAVKFEVRDSDDLSKPPLKCIYARNHKTGWVSELYLSVRGKEKAPTFSEEVKLLLPPSLTSRHHLLISFYNLDKVKKATKVQPKLLGYAYHPLYVNGRINLRPEVDSREDDAAKLSKKESQRLKQAANHHEDYCIALPVIQATDIESGYLSPAAPPHMMDGGRPLFQMKYNLMSTIYPEDSVITRLFHTFGKSEEELSSKEVVDILQTSRQMSGLLAIQYMPVIIKILLEIMTNRERKVVNPPLQAFKCLVIVLHKIKCEMGEKVSRTSLLELYINYIFDQSSGSKKPIYEPLCFNFLLFMMEKKMQGEEEDDSIFVNSWFMFDLIIKSMALHLHERGVLNAQNRTSLFPDSYRRSLAKLLSYLTTYMKVELPKGKTADMKVLNRNMAVFFKDLFYIYDRGLVLDMIRTYLAEITDETQYEITTQFKFEFLTIVNDHDYFIQLNLPFGYDNDMHLPKLSQKHPLAMILLYEVIETLASGNTKAANDAIGSLYDVIIKHYYNQRFSTAECRERVARIFFALLPLLIKQWSSTERSLEKWRNAAKVMEKREFYVLALYVLKHSSPDRMRQWVRQESPKNLQILCEIMVDMVTCFEYSIDHKRQTKSLMSSELALFMTEVGSDEMKELLKGSQDKVRNPGEELERLKQMSLEANLAMLEVLELILSVNQTNFLANARVPLLGKIVNVFVAMMKKDQTEEFVHHLYATLRAFANKFQVILFKGDNSFVGQLVRQVLRHCSFHNMSVNTEAATFLFILLKLNHLQVGTFSRTRIQAITSVSKLVSDRILKEDSMLKLSFARLSEFALHHYSTFAQKDLGYGDQSRKGVSYVHAQFTRGVQGLGETLGTILRDTIRVKQMEETADPEMIADLYYQIAQGYMNTPDLRIEWLMQLAEFQSKHAHAAEAGMCLVHVAALIADYLVSLVGNKTVNPDLFSQIYPGLSEFAGDEEGLCQTNHFSVDGFTKALAQAIEYFREATLFEFASVLYDLMTPVYYSESLYGRLSETFQKQSELWQMVETQNEQRLLGTYFRVGFYGQKYGEELDGSEWIYKEAALTHLFDLKDRFIEFWSKRLGCDVDVIDASKDTALLDPEKCYIQITKVEPYFSPEEKSSRKRFVEQNVTLRKFVIVTPFSSKGKAQTDDLADQFTKKTILIVKGSFPYMLTRLPVVQRDVIIINPIDNSINALRERCEQFDEQLQLKQYSTLSQILQGTVLVMVSQGPLEICHVFLGNWQLYEEEKITELIGVIRVFVSKCGELLELNHELTTQTSGSWTFHFECLAGYQYVRSSMLEFVNAVEYARGRDDGSDPYSESFTETTEVDGVNSDDEDGINSHGSSSLPSTPKAERKKARSGSVKASKKKREGSEAEASPRRHKKSRKKTKLGVAPTPPVDVTPPETPPRAPTDDEEY